MGCPVVVTAVLTHGWAWWAWWFVAHGPVGYAASRMHSRKLYLKAVFSRAGTTPGPHQLHSLTRGTDKHACVAELCACPRPWLLTPVNPWVNLHFVTKNYNLWLKVAALVIHMLCKYVRQSMASDLRWLSLQGSSLCAMLH